MAIPAVKSKQGKSKEKGKQKKGGKGSKERTVFMESSSASSFYGSRYTHSQFVLRTTICRTSLPRSAEYRRLVIEPYILPPIQQALAHPSVAPYVQKLQPYADYAVRTATPMAILEQAVVPLYQKYAVPQLIKLDAQVAPYRTRVEQEYERTVGPQPYVVLAAQKTYGGYQVARPYARPVWEQTKVILGHLAAFLGEQRRQFVDPHVHKIWEHVKEMSNGKPPVSTTSSLRSAASSQVPKVSSRISKASSSLSSTVSSVASSASIAASESPKAALSSASSSVARSPKTSHHQCPKQPKTHHRRFVRPLRVHASASSTASSIHSAASDAVASSASSVVEGSSSTLSEAPESAASSIAESATTVASSAASPEVTTLADQAPSDNLNPHASETEAAPVTVTETLAVPETAAAVPTPAAETVPEDEDLFSDLDLDFFEDLAREDEPVQPTKELWEIERDREIAQRDALAKVANKRADITSRHTKWEERLDERISANKKALRKSLVAIRKAAVVEVKEGAVRKEMESLVADWEKYMRGAEKFLANLSKEKGKPENKRAKWDRVLTKLDDKFAERLQQTEALVNGWYEGVLDKELEQMNRLTEEVKKIADDAQADIGLDYAYLDDVTVADWERYHALVKKSDNFTALAQSVQDGSHPSPPINPILLRSRSFRRRSKRSSPAGTLVSASSITIGRGKAEVEAALNRVAEAEGRKTSSPDEPEKVKDADAVAQSLNNAVAKESSPAHAEL
ncbi:uncharacterized protein BXZ73DRAFT_75400 [Epithele typhae]|uniref:uncharacterized protein n=1 Tax=Epithele typhae TaxID=378194 RepID=UPI00200805D3|nr:uncharacterized protein BXZ73DRAFT_75400 [Epithele typhae]KAH9940873.1 hypothetical protein BXZ73DRAFT_75400 [Epithele typhae]